MEVTAGVGPPPLEDRQHLQQELNDFVETCYKTLEEVTASLGWSLDELDSGEGDSEEQEQNEAVVCPYDPNHHMPKSSLVKHMASCRLRKLDYTKEEEAEMYDSAFFYGNAKIPVVHLDKNLQFQILKQARASSGRDGDVYSQIIGGFILQCLLKCLRITSVSSVT